MMENARAQTEVAEAVGLDFSNEAVGLAAVVRARLMFDR